MALTNTYTFKPWIRTLSKPLPLALWFRVDFQVPVTLDQQSGPSYLPDLLQLSFLPFGLLPEVCSSTCHFVAPLRCLAPLLAKLFFCSAFEQWSQICNTGADQATHFWWTHLLEQTSWQASISVSFCQISTLARPVWCFARFAGSTSQNLDLKTSKWLTVHCLALNGEWAAVCLQSRTKWEIEKKKET